MGDAVSIARALSKLGWCSRARALELVLAGRVTVDGRVVRDPAARVDLRRARLAVDGTAVRAAARTWLMMNKPAGYVTTTADERGRPTVFELLPRGLPRLNAVGRLDMESEGLLLFTNDTRQADRVLDPRTHIDKVYQVQLDRAPDERDRARALDGVAAGRGEVLSFKQIRESVHGPDWLEVVLDEGRNRQVRRVLESLGYRVIRLVRTAIGPLGLGDLAPGETRPLSAAEQQQLTAVRTAEDG